MAQIQTSQQNISRPQSPSLKLKHFFQQSACKIGFINPLKNLFENVSRLKLEISISSQNKTINDNSLGQLMMQQQSNFNKNMSKAKKQINNESNANIINNQNEVSNQFSQFSLPQSSNNDKSITEQNSISKIQVLEKQQNKSHQIQKNFQSAQRFLQQQRQQIQHGQVQQLNYRNQGQNNSGISKEIKQNQRPNRQNYHSSQNKGSISALSKLTNFFIEKSPQKCKQKQSTVNQMLIHGLQNLSVSENSRTAINQTSKVKQNIQIKDLNSNILACNFFSNKQFKKQQTKSTQSVLVSNSIKDTKINLNLNLNSSPVVSHSLANYNSISYHANSKQAIFQKSKYQIQNNQFLNFQSQQLFRQQSKQDLIGNHYNNKYQNQNYNQNVINSQSLNEYNEHSSRIQPENIKQDIQREEVDNRQASQDYQNQYKRIFQSADRDQHQKKQDFQIYTRKRVQTQMNNYNPKHNTKQSGQNEHSNNKLSKIRQTQELGIFNTQIHTGLGSSKVSKIRQAKQYKKKILEVQLAKVSAQIQILQTKQNQIRQFHSPKQFNDRVKINDDPQARKKAISLVKNLRVQKVSRNKAKISQFDQVDKKINDYMVQLTKIRQQNQIRAKQKKFFQIIERMKKKQMQKIKQQKKLNANVQFVHQFKNQTKLQSYQNNSLKPNSPQVRSPQSKQQRRKSQWRQMEEDGATPQLANKKAYLNKIRNLSNKKSSKLDSYQSKLN